MFDLPTVMLAAVFATFLAAGLVKGVTGMGLPTVAMGMLGALISPLVAASLLGFLLKTLLGGHPIYALSIGGISLLVAGVCVLFVRQPIAHKHH